MKQDQPEWLQKKCIDPAHLEETVSKIRSSGKTIGTLNGSFDLLHAGHLYIIYQASLQADCLIVALNTDASIRKYKSPNRPFVSLADRLEMMAALQFVDYVTWFDETDPRALLARIKPDVHCNGVEYGADCIEAEVVRQNGGRIHLIDRLSGLSTSALVEKIKRCE